MRRGVLPLFLAALCFCPPAAGSDSPVIAVAANLSHPLTRIAERFAAQAGVRVRMSFGSSGNFTRQIRQGAPYELFLSADRSYADVLEAEGMTSGPATAFAMGRTGVFIPAGSILSGAMDLEGFIRLLARGAYRRIAMANPEHAPFGVAAREALQSAGVWAVERDRVLLAENAAQAVQFTFSGSVDAGIIPYSFALLPEIRDKGRFFLFPADWHHPLEQIMVLLKNAGAEARSFADFLRTETARGILEESGYSAPGME